MSIRIRHDLFKLRRMLLSIFWRKRKPTTIFRRKWKPITANSFSTSARGVSGYYSKLQVLVLQGKLLFSKHRRQLQRSILQQLWSSRLSLEISHVVPCLWREWKRFSFVLRVDHFLFIVDYAYRFSPVVRCPKNQSILPGRIWGDAHARLTSFNYPRCPIPVPHSVCAERRGVRWAPTSNVGAVASCAQRTCKIDSTEAAKSRLLHMDAHSENYGRKNILPRPGFQLPRA